MALKCYNIAGLHLGLESEDSIRDSEGFLNFYTAEKPDVLFKIIRSELPEKNSEKIFSDDKKAYYADEENEYMYSSFYDAEKREFREYACRVIGKNANYLYIDYDEIWEAMLFDSLNLPDIMIKCGIALMHASFVIYNGEAIVFTADKQVGKSTQANLWREYAGATVANGDRAAVKIKENSLVSYGTPFCGSSRISLKISAPVRAVVVLGQAKENTIKKLSPKGAFMNILGKITYDTWNRESVCAASDIAAFIAENVPVYKFDCRPDKTAVEFLKSRIGL